MLTIKQIEEAIANKQYIVFKTFSGKSIILPKHIFPPYVETEFEIHCYDFFTTLDKVSFNEDISINYINHLTKKSSTKIINENEFYNWVFENVRV